MEYEVEAEYTHEFVRSGSRGHAYTPIVASGANSCILHYIENSRPCHDGDLLLLDCGAEYGNYNADLTRTIPVNGRFSPRQREVYEAVLRVHKALKAMLVTGNNWLALQQASEELLTEEALKLGILTSEQVRAADSQNSPLPRRAIREFYPHGFGHHLGLDVHDVGNKYLPFAPGMVYTIEPGLYIREEGIGIRIENNVLITAEGNHDLMAHIPYEVDEIEALMAQR
jgi:Xaa-Pro aminopeptidase